MFITGKYLLIVQNTYVQIDTVQAHTVNGYIMKAYTAIV